MDGFIWSGESLTPESFYEGSNVIPIAPKQRTIREMNKEIDMLKAEIKEGATLIGKMYNAINMFHNQFQDFKDKIDPPPPKPEPTKLEVVPELTEEPKE
jgi:hypothetical protein